MEKGKSAVEEQNKPEESTLTSDEKPSCIHKITVPPETTEVTPEDRASKIKRLKSGFRVCKPPGSFLWPNMAMSPQPNKDAAKLEDFFLVPTPTSVSPSTASSSPHHLLSPLGPRPNFLVKPLPERPPLTITSTAAVTRPTHPPPPEAKNRFETVTSTDIITTATSIRTSIIDLNAMPCPHTYQRRNQHEKIPTNTIPCFEASEKEAEIRQREEDERKEILRECDQKQNGSSSMVSSSSSSACLSRVSGN